MEPDRKAIVSTVRQVFEVTSFNVPFADAGDRFVGRKGGRE